MKRAVFAALVLSVALHALVGAQQVGPNVNVLAGTEERTGDAFLQRQNEAVMAISSRNSDHLIVAMNDYRTVDFVDTTVEETNNGIIARLLGLTGKAKEAFERVRASTPPEAWIGLAFSRDRGRTWYTGLLPGYPQDPTTVGQSSPVYGDSAGSDPVLVTGQNGRVYLIALTFDRDGISRISATRYTDRNNVEGGEPFYYDFTRQIARGSQSSKGRFADKPSGAAFAGDTASVFSPGGVSKKKKHVVVVPGCERVYTAYTVFEGVDAAGNFRNNVYAAVSANCGESWGTPTKISGPYTIDGTNYPGTRNQGTSTAVDPDTGHVYVGWRTYEPNGFVYVRSTDGGLSWSAPQPLTTSQVYPFDQPLITGTAATGNAMTFRSNAYPSLLVYDGTLLAAWQDRVDEATGAPSPTGVPRIVMSRGTRDSAGNIVWIAPAAVDLKDSGVNGYKRCELEIPQGETTAQTVCRLTGAQVMPHLTARDGQVAVAYYESRHQDPDAILDPEGAPGGIAPTTGYISGMQRQVDARAAIIDPDTWTTVSSFQISRYPVDPKTGRIMENPSAPDPQLRRRVNYANYPMFRGGIAAFIGDYLHGIPLRADGSNPGFRFVFTSNELVVPPPDLDFTKYDKPQTGVVSGCNPGSRNSTIMTTEVGTGLVLGSPGTFKQLLDINNQPLQRAFAVYVENHTPAVRGFRLTFENVATGVVASFEQFFPAGAPVTTVDVEVLGGSSVTRSVFLSGTNTTGSVAVRATEIPLPDLDPDPNKNPVPVLVPALTATLTLNGDPSNPFVGGLDGNPGLASTETHTPQLGTPQLGTPQLGTPQLGTPQLGTPQLGTPQLSTPQLGTTAEGDPTYTDVTLEVTNGGNTASGFNSLVALTTAPHLNATGHGFQVFVYRVHQSAAVSGCGVGLAQQDQIIYMTPQLGTPQLGTPQLGTPQLGTPQLGTPQLGTPQLATPQLATPQLATASFSVAPGDPTPDAHDGTEHQHQGDDTVRLTLRVIHPPNEDFATAHPDPVTEFLDATAVAVEAQAANTGETEPDGAFVDRIAPETVVLQAPASPTPDTSATLTFTGSDNLSMTAALAFQCSLDGAAYAPCTSPVSLTGLSAATHTFSVRAVDQAGNIDLTPAGATWAVVVPTVTIDTAVPGTAAPGFGQLITLTTTGAPADTPSAVFTQGTTVAQGFVFESPSKQNEYFVRLPFPNDNVADGNATNGLTPGAATVRLVFGGSATSQDFGITVSTTPGTPVARFALGLVSSPTPVEPCGIALASATPITETYAGDGIAVSAYGIDTTGATAVFTQGTTALEVPATCAYSSDATGVAATFPVPSSLTPGPVDVQLKTRVGEFDSALSAPLTLTIAPPITFAAPEDYAAATGPEGVAAGDLNGDGNLDLVTSNFNAGVIGSFSVRLGDGAGGFGARSDSPAGAGPRAVELADLNKDGALDVVVANLNGGTVSVALNQGDGTFFDTVNWAAGGSNNGLALADVNRDTNLDIVVAKNGDLSADNVGVLLGNGDGTFQTQVLFSAGTFAWGVGVADFNKDGWADLAVSNRDSQNVSILLGTGTAALFGAAAQFAALPAGSTASLFAMAVADLTSDGIPDVVVGTNSGSISVLTGVGNGTLGAAQVISSPGFNRPLTPAVADFNGDARPDIAVANFDSSTISVLRATGAGRFAAPVEIAAGAGPADLVTGDFDGNGKVDIATVRSRVDILTVLLNTTATNGSALSFDGLDDFALVAHQPSLSLSALTLEAWVLVDDPAFFRRPMISKGSDFGNYTFSILGNETSATPGAVEYAHQVTGGNLSCCGTAAIAFGGWTHVAATFAGGALKVYVNGQLKGSVTGASPLQNLADLFLGRAVFGSATEQNLKGLLDEVRIWNVARTSAEIAADYNRVVAPGTAGLVAYWKFDEARTDQAIEDSSGQGNHGTLGATSAIAADDPRRVPSTAPVFR